ncbi:hypothetical protein JM93_02363 [Roseibium hamelinense]|uniref:DUF2125 domain-containing protein n=1 Tax=Roseibium hamelinense TaxID=150831 RepID=A0A562T0N7_9HYPH|nr:hypothetical protein [Roseibium hamelinense]MTI43795.1 hypothetical protein [Roseibium hamelinense]TWI87125.1 hypothetical protein JM93_02363 [Roseibium hamelinense]
MSKSPSIFIKDRRKSGPVLKLRVLAASGLSAAALLFNSTAYAQSAAEKAYLAYADQLQALGIEVSQGPISYDAATDALKVPDATLSVSGEFKLPVEQNGNAAAAGQQTVSLTLTYTSSMTTIRGMTHENGAYFAESWTNSDDTQFLGAAAVDGEDLGRMEVTLTGVLAENYAFTIPEPPADAPDQLASRWLPILKASLLTSYDVLEVASLSGTVTVNPKNASDAPESVSGTFETIGYRMSDAVDGQVAAFEIESSKQEFTTTLPDGQILKQTTTQGLTSYTGLNAAPFIDLLDPDVEETGEPIVILGSQSIENYVSSQDIAPGQKVSVSIGEIAADDMTLTKRDFAYLEFLDEFLTQQEPDVYEALTAMFQLYRSFGLGEAQASDMVISFPNPDAPSEELIISIGQMGMRDVSSDGIVEVFVADVDAPKLPEGASFSLGRASFGDLDFATYEEMAPIIKQLVENEGQTPADLSPIEIARAFTPSSISIALEELEVGIPGEGDVSIANFEQRFASSVPPIPTEIYSETEGAVLPLSALEDPQAIALFKSLGLENLSWSDETNLYWDENTLELVLERLMVNIEGVGRAEAQIKFANVPKALFEDPEHQAQIALVMASFVEAEVHFVDAGVTAKAIDQLASDAGLQPTAFIQGLVAQTEAILEPVNNPEFTEDVTNAIAEFLSAPGTIRLTLRPQNPVPLAQIVGGAITPQVLPGLLNAQVTASQ